MHKFSVVTVVAVVLLVVPAFASAVPVVPTGSEISTPSGPAYLTVDRDHPAAFDVAGTTIGGAGAVDIRCYWGDKSVLLAGPVPVVNGAFAAAPALDTTTLTTLGYPRPFCTLRAVPTGTVPVAAPGTPSAWAGPAVSFGEQTLFHLDGDVPDVPGPTWDYRFALSQPDAFNDYNSVGSCGLCDTYLFASGSKAVSNPIWNGNAGLYRVPRSVPGRTAVTIDGVGAYASGSAWFGSLAQSSGFPAIAASRSVDPVTGDMTIDETSEFKTCAPDPAVVPPTATSCTSFGDTGVVLHRVIRQRDGGLRVTIVDHWNSVDGLPHELDALYEDSVVSTNGLTAGHELRADFTWTAGGFRAYAPSAQIPLPPGVPATLLVSTDRSSPATGDNVNPFGAMVFGTPPSHLSSVGIGQTDGTVSRWHSGYERTIPAGGEVVVAVAYVHAFTLDAVKAKAQAAALALPAFTPPADQAPTGQPSAAQADAVPAGDAAPASVPHSESAAVVAPKPVRCVVPALRGKTLAKAKRLLAHAHCRLGRVVRKPSANVRPGRVLATRLKTGTRHRPGTRVRVTVAKKR